MKLKPILLGIVVMLGILAPVASAHAGGVTLPVTMDVKGSSSHLLSERSILFEREVMSIKAFADTTIKISAAIVQEAPVEPQPWSAAYVFRLCGDKDDRASAGVLRKITDLTRGNKLRVNLDGYAGASLRKAVPVAAVLLGMQWQAFDQAWISGHVGAITTSGQPSGLCVGVSATVRFNSGGGSSQSTNKVVLSQMPANR